MILAHPLADSLCAHLAKSAEAALQQAGRETRWIDLYRSDFDPRLTHAERRSYQSPIYESAAPPEFLETLRQAETIVLVFPAWWFGMPAILKGYFDRVFSPGIAFDHTPGFGPIRPRLDRLREVVVVATFGTPWWVDWLVMHRPLRRVLRSAVFGACAPQARVHYFPFYLSEAASRPRVEHFTWRLGRRLARLRP